MSERLELTGRRWRRLARRAALATAIATLGLAGGMAWAGIPNSSTGVISACYVKTGAAAGSLRVINSQGGAHCKSSEIALSWSSAAGLRFRGAWASTSAYRKNDIVTRSGSSYLARIANTGVPTSNTINWAVLAARGPAGPRGATGPTSAGAFFHVATYSNTAANDWENIASFSYSVPTKSNVVARYSAESFCNASSWCSARILVDGAEMTGGSGSGAAFDDGDPGSTWEAHSIDRYAPALAPGAHTFTVQMMMLGSTGQTFRLDDANLVLQSIG